MPVSPDALLADGTRDRSWMPSITASLALALASPSVSSSRSVAKRSFAEVRNKREYMLGAIGAECGMDIEKGLEGEADTVLLEGIVGGSIAEDMAATAFEME